MNNNNPAEMSNDDLEKDMDLRNLEIPKGNQEKLNRSTAAEGTLKTPEEDAFSKVNLAGKNKANEEQGKLIHATAEEEDSQDGSIPDPEEVGNWENDDDDLDKISG